MHSISPQTISNKALKLYTLLKEDESQQGNLARYVLTTLMQCYFHPTTGEPLVMLAAGAMVANDLVDGKVEVVAT